MALKHADAVEMCIARTKEYFKGHTHPRQPKKLYPLARGVVAHPFDVLAWGARPHVGRWEAIFAGGGNGCGSCDASCVGAKATEKCNKNAHISFF
jgi:hypothetical protein